MTTTPPPAEFDRHAKDYTDILDHSLRPSGFTSDHFAERKVREMRSVLERAGVAGHQLRILNFGCGIGTSEPHLARSFPAAEILSVDVSAASIDEARRRAGDLPRVRFSVFDGRHVPFAGPFDVMLLAGVLHHIPPGQRHGILRELRRSLTDEGHLFLFEHNPWNPVTRRIVHDCPLDVNATLIAASAASRLLRDAGFGRVAVRFIHFFPALLRLFVPFERWLRRVPIGAQYYCVAQQRAQADRP